MEFKEWLQAEMDARKIGPSDLARMAKVPQPTIFRILSGETKDPRTGTVKRLERALGVQSPPLEAATQHQELIEAWELLTQEQRQEYLLNIKSQAASNQAILEQLTQPPNTVRVRERQHQKKALIQPHFIKGKKHGSA